MRVIPELLYNRARAAGANTPGIYRLDRKPRSVLTRQYNGANVRTNR